MNRRFIRIRVWVGLIAIGVTAGCLVRGIATFTASAQGITTITASDTVVTSSVKRFGINLGWANFFDSGQIMKQLLFQNPGFESQVYRSIIRCASGTATTCLSDNPFAAWSDGFWQGADYEIIWGVSKGRTGVIAGSSTASGLSTGTGPTFQFADSGVIPSAGDYLVVRKTETGGATVGWAANTSGGGTVTMETADLSPDTQGRQAVRLTATGTGQTASLSTYFETSRYGSFIQMNGTFRLSFRAKGTGGANALGVSLSRLSPGSVAFLNQSRTLSSSWANINMDFTANENGRASGTAELRFTAQNQSGILLDDVSLSQIDGDPTNTTAFRDAVVDTLRAYNPGILRYWVEDLGDSLDNEIAPPLARLRSGYSTHATFSNYTMYGLHEFLELCELLGAEAWYIVPPSFSAQEMTNLIEYLSGPGTSLYGAKRGARGHPAPWTDVLPKIHLEFGNESWNLANYVGGAIQNSLAYGNRASELFGIAKKSPYYAGAKYDMILGGQADFLGRTLSIHTASANHDSLAVAPYFGGTIDNFATNEELFGPLFAEPEMINQTGNMRRNYDSVQASSKRVPLAVYEVNLHSTRGSIPQAALDTLTPSVGAGLAVADHMLMMLRDLKIRDQNLYSLTQYANATLDPNKRVLLWGVVRDMGVTNRKRPQYLAVKLANEAIAGDLVQTTQSGDNPTWNQALLNTVQYNNAHYIQSYAFSSGSNRSLIVFNLSRTSSLPVNFAGVNTPVGTVTLKQLTSASITDTNEDAENVKVTSQILNNFGASQSVSLPPFSMTVFQWQVLTSTYNFSVTDRGATSLTTAGSMPSTTVGYARIQPNTGNSVPSGLAIFGFRENNVLVTEAGVPATPSIQSGRIYAQISAATNTGLAIANPNTQAAAITFFFTDSNGNNFGNGTTTVPAGGQIAAFLNEAPFNGRASTIGTFTFSSTVPVAAVALEGLVNERSEFLITTLPVVDLSQTQNSAPIFFAHFASGGGWGTQVILLNPTDQTLNGSVQFFGQGTPGNTGSSNYGSRWLFNSAERHVASRYLEYVKYS